MTTELLEKTTNDIAVAFPIAEEAIAAMSEQCMALRINGVEDKEGYAVVRENRLIIKAKRVEVEKKRVELKADALEWGRKVDARAKALTKLLEPIEDHLAAEEKAYDEERDRIKREAAEAKQRKLQARVDAMQRYRAVCDLKTLSEMEDGEFDIALQKAMQEDASRREIEAEQAAERKRIEEERAELDHQRAALEAEQRRFADEQAERERAAQAERDRIAAEERRAAEDKARAEREAADRVRIEALRPDREKLLTVVAAIQAIDVPDVSDAMNAVRNKVVEGLARSARIIETIITSEVSA